MMLPGPRKVWRKRECKAGLCALPFTGLVCRIFRAVHVAWPGIPSHVEEFTDKELAPPSTPQGAVLNIFLWMKITSWRALISRLIFLFSIGSKAQTY